VTNRILLLLFLVVLFVVTPSIAQANMGTPLMWSETFHLIFLNGFIGIFEAFVVARLFRVSANALLPVIMAANYFSMLAGCFIIPQISPRLERLIPGPAPLFKALTLLILLTFTTWSLSNFLEWPFFQFGLRRSGVGWRKSLCGSALAQTCSYAALIPFYLLVSPISVLTGADIQRDLSFVKSPNATVYFLDPGDGGVWTIRTDGTERKRIAVATSHDRNARLFISRSDISDHFDLCEVIDSNKKTTLIKYNITLTGPFLEDRRNDTWFNFGPADSFQNPERSKWKVWTGFWASEGLTVFSQKSRLYNLAFDTPFMSWLPRNATMLPMDQVVFQLGEQIVILDLPTKKLGFLTMGIGPCVVLK
jgi:hypothetical protein